MPRRRSSGGEAAGAVDVIPDHLRCRRTDGRRWRCPMRAMAEFNFCEHHYLLVRRNMARHNKAAAETSETRGVPGPLSCDIEEPSDPPEANQRSNGEVVPDDELIAAAVWRQMEKKEEKKKKNGAMAPAEGREAAEVTRDLPNGVMTISPAAKRARGNADPPVDRKLGLKQGPFLRRIIRSKNAELVPLSTLKRFPCNKGLGTRKKKACHQCGDRKGAQMVRCSSCRKRFFCSNCIKNWYCDMTEMEAKDACPVCRGHCNCMTCRHAEASEDEYKDLLDNQNKYGRMKQMHCLISQLFPVLRQINQKQLNELEIEAKCQGRRFSHVQLQVVERTENVFANCNLCDIPLNFHRCCLNCSYRLCLSCCGDTRKKQTSDMAATVTQRPGKKRKSCKLLSKELNGVKQTLPRRLWPDDCPSSMGQSSSGCNETKSGCNLCCPLKELGGCGDGVLKLMVFLPFSRSKELGTVAVQLTNP